MFKTYIQESTMVHNGIFEKGRCVQNLPIITAVGSHTAIKIGINVKYTEVDGNKKVDSSDHQIVIVQFDVEYFHSNANYNRNLCAKFCQFL